LVRETLDKTAVEYHYDDAGNLIGQTTPSGDTLGFGYDPDQRLETLTDWNGGTTRWHYANVEGGFTQRYPSHLVSLTRHDAKGKPTALEVERQDQSRPFALGFAYDAEDRLHTSFDSQFGTRRYYYDRESRLLAVDADHSQHRERFAYDPAGNRIFGNGKQAGFDAGDRIIHQGDLRCGYDAQGNLTTLRARDRARTLAWNRRGLLVSAVSADGTQVTFGYDAFGRRIRKRTIGTGNPTPTETRYWWAGEQLIAEAQWEGQRLIRRQEYGYLPGTTIPFATRIDGQVYYYHCDHLGTPRRLTNAFGEVVWAADYDAFGQARIARDLIHNPLRFAG